MPRGISRRVGTHRLPVTSYVVLGLVGQKPGAGYPLAIFASRSIANMWPITRSQIYSELPRLEALGLVTGEDVAQEKLPDKRVYALTEAGRAALREWVADDVVEERFHSSLLAQLFFAGVAGRDEARRIVETVRERGRVAEHHMQGVVDGLASRPEAFFPRLTALYAVRESQCRQAWAEEALALLGQATSEAPTEP